MLTQIVKEKAQQTVARAQSYLAIDAARQTADTTRTLVQRTWAQLASRIGIQKPAAEPVVEAAPVTRRTPDAALEDLSRAELYALACELDVKGRKNMKKTDLITSIRATRGF